MDQTPDDTWVNSQPLTTPYTVVDIDNGGPATELYDTAPEQFHPCDNKAIYFLELFISTASEVANLEDDMAVLKDRLTKVYTWDIWYRPESSNRWLVGYRRGKELPSVGDLGNRVTAMKLVQSTEQSKMPTKNPPGDQKGPGPSQGRGGKKAGKSNLGGPVVVDIGDEPGLV